MNSSKGVKFLGANRNDDRVYAGVDLIVSVGTKTVAMTYGTVIQSYYFYKGTDAVEVKNDDGTIVRYTEIFVHVKSGQKVKIS